MAKTGAQGRNHKVAKRALCPFINAKIIEVANSGDVASLLHVIREHLEDMNLVNMTTSLHRLAKGCSERAAAMGLLSQEVNQLTLQDLLARIAEALSRSDPALNDSRRQALSNIIWSLGTLRCVEPRLVQLTAGLAMGQLTLFKPFELVSTIWAFAKLGALHAGVRETVAPLQTAALAPISAVVGRLGLRFLAMAAWALAASGLSGEPLMSKLASRMLPMLRGADCLPELLMDVAWAFSSAGLRHERMLQELALQARRELRRFEGPELLKLCQLLSSEGVVCQELFDACAWLQPALPVLPAPALPLAPRSALRAGAAVFTPGGASPAAPSQGGSWSKVEVQRATGSTVAGEELEAADAETSSEWGESDSGEDATPETRAPASSGSPGSPSPTTCWADLSDDAEPIWAKWAQASPGAAKYSVKNTFLELEDEALAEEEAELSRRLPAALPVAVAAFGSDELEALRLRYQKSRDL